MKIPGKHQCQTCGKPNVQERMSKNQRPYKANVASYTSGDYFRSLHTDEECAEYKAKREAQWQAKRDFDGANRAYGEEGQALTARIAERIKNEGPEAWPECSHIDDLEQELGLLRRALADDANHGRRDDARARSRRNVGVCRARGLRDRHPFEVRSEGAGVLRRRVRADRGPR